MRFRPSLIAVMSATMLTVAFSPWLLAQGRVPTAEGIWKKLDPSGKPEAEFRIILAAEKITLWDSWLRRELAERVWASVWQAVIVIHCQLARVASTG